MLIGLGLFEDYIGGISAYQSTFVRELRKHGYPVSVMIPRTHSDLPEDSISPEGVHIYRFGNPQGRLHRITDHWIDARRCFLKIHTRQPVQLINVHFALSAWGVLQLKEAKALPKLMHFHGPWPLEWLQEQQELNRPPGHGARLKAKLMTAIERNVVRQADRVILKSHAFEPWVSETLGIEPSRRQVIPIGWNEETIPQPIGTRQQCRDRLDLPQDQRIIVTVRRLIRRTGVDMLIEAVAGLVAEYPDVVLLIAGKGPEEAALKAQAQACGLTGDNIRFLGFVPQENLPDLYRAADLTVVPTRSLEGFGITLLESLVAGTPAIGTPVGGIPEVLRPLALELVTAAADARALKAKLKDWLSGELLLPDEHECRRYVTQSYHWDTIFPAFEQILQSLTQTTPGTLKR